MKMITRINRMGLVIVLIAGLTGISLGQDAKGTINAGSAVKGVEGEVSAVNKQGIAVILNRDLQKGTENEIFLPFEKEKIRIVHKRNIDEIQVGDIVKVEYEILTEETKEGGSSKFNARTITFLKPAKKNPLPPEPPAAGNENEGEALPLKGIK